jgi:hypothetical protein
MAAFGAINVVTRRQADGYHQEHQTTRPQRRSDFSELDMNTAIERIGQEVLGLATLETRNSDALDFSEQAVWTLRRALEAAYKAGQATRA